MCLHGPRNGRPRVMWRPVLPPSPPPPAYPLINLMKAISYTVMSLLTAWPALALPPQWEISNTSLRVKLYLPDAEHGFYRGTRFDWSGVVADLQYKGHSYYGPWFTATDPKIPDFIYKGSDIVAGPCSAITGPVEEFSAVGFDEA